MLSQTGAALHSLNPMHLENVLLQVYMIISLHIHKNYEWILFITEFYKIHIHFV